MMGQHGALHQSIRVLLIMLEISLAQQSEELNPAPESFAAHATHSLPRASGVSEKARSTSAARR